MKEHIRGLRRSYQVTLTGLLTFEATPSPRMGVADMRWFAARAQLLQNIQRCFTLSQCRWALTPMALT